MVARRHAARRRRDAGQGRLRGGRRARCSTRCARRSRRPAPTPCSAASRRRYVVDGMFEVVDAGIPLAVLYIENIPVHDAIRMCAYAKARGTRILGPNSAGVVSPGRANMSDLNDANMRPGRIGIVSKSGTLTYEVIDELHRHGLGRVDGGLPRRRPRDRHRLRRRAAPVRGRPGHRPRGRDRRARRRPRVPRGSAGRRGCARRSWPTSPARAARRTHAWATPAPSSATTSAAGRRARWRRSRPPGSPSPRRVTDIGALVTRTLGARRNARDRV